MARDISVKLQPAAHRLGGPPPQPAFAGNAEGRRERPRGVNSLERTLDAIVQMQKPQKQLAPGRKAQTAERGEII